ncbi:MAG TPA: DUF885 family protein, partial [Vicinamibacterales bacterium]|nr:DUF885 family protein [Vicinamibacterales bacterium]
ETNCAVAFRSFDRIRETSCNAPDAASSFGTLGTPDERALAGRSVAIVSQSRASGDIPPILVLSELYTKRGTSDALYGYYTLGKLMILKLQDDYRRKMGAAYTLQGFHDAFIRLGPLPLPLIRKAMLGEEGSPLS